MSPSSLFPKLFSSLLLILYPDFLSSLWCFTSTSLLSTMSLSSASLSASSSSDWMPANLAMEWEYAGANLRLLSEVGAGRKSLWGIGEWGGAVEDSLDPGERKNGGGRSGRWWAGKCDASIGCFSWATRFRNLSYLQYRYSWRKNKAKYSKKSNVKKQYVD